MKLTTSYEYPPIPWRKFDWIAFDGDQMSGVCGDEDCDCRSKLVRGWGETEEIAIHAFVSELLERHEIEMPIQERDFYAEAVAIHRGETLMLPTREHINAVFDRLVAAGTILAEDKSFERLRRTTGPERGQHRATAQ